MTIQAVAELAKVVLVGSTGPAGVSESILEGFSPVAAVAGELWDGVGPADVLEPLIRHLDGLLQMVEGDKCDIGILVLVILIWIAACSWCEGILKVFHSVICWLTEEGDEYEDKNEREKERKKRFAVKAKVIFNEKAVIALSFPDRSFICLVLLTPVVGE